MQGLGRDGGAWTWGGEESDCSVARLPPLTYSGHVPEGAVGGAWPRVARGGWGWKVLQGCLLLPPVQPLVCSLLCSHGCHSQRDEQPQMDSICHCLPMCLCLHHLPYGLQHRLAVHGGLCRWLADSLVGAGICGTGRYAVYVVQTLQGIHSFHQKGENFQEII